MQTDVGCDPSGESACDVLLEEVAGDDVLLRFPPGRYLFAEEHRFDGLENFGLVGTGQHHRDVEFVFPTGYSGIFLGLWNGSDWLLENFTLQQSMDRSTGVGLDIVGLDGVEIRDVETAGFSPYNENGGRRGLYCDILEPDGVGVIDRYVHRGPSQVGDYPNGTQAFLADQYHRGTLYLRDWRIENAGENGIYASQTPGQVRVEGGFFRNNDVASIRVCGAGSYIRNATVVVDTENDHPLNDGAYAHTRGIWWESGPLSKSGGLIEGCDLVMRSSGASQGLLRIERTAGAVTVRDCRLTNFTERSTIDVVEPNRSVSMNPHGFHAVDLEIAASGTGLPPLQIRGRPGSTVERVTVRAPDSKRDGVVLEASPETTIDSSRILAGRFPIRIESNSARRSCLVEVSDDVEIESSRYDGGILLSTGGPPENGTPFHRCAIGVPGVEYETMVIVSNDDEGLRGFLLADDGRFVPANGLEF